MKRGDEIPLQSHKYNEKIKLLEWEVESKSRKTLYSAIGSEDEMNLTTLVEESNPKAFLRI